MTELEKEQAKWCTPAEWIALESLCRDHGIPMGQESLEYGSIFLTYKCVFRNGWAVALEEHASKCE